MGIADSMKSITENIVGSYDVRVKALKDLVIDTHKTIKGFTADRKQMSEKQAMNLAAFVNALTKNVGTMLKGFQASHKEMSEEQSNDLESFVKSIAKDVAETLKGFQTDREKMSEGLKESLAKAANEIESYAKKRLKEFDEAHTEMSGALKKSLTKYVSDMASDVKKLLGEDGSDMAKAKAAWQGMAGSLAKSRKGGGMPRIEAGEEVTTVEGAV